MAASGAQETTREADRGEQSPRHPPRTDLAQNTPRPRRRKASGSNLTRRTSVRLDLVWKSVKISLTRNERANGGEDGEGRDRLRARPTLGRARIRLDSSCGSATASLPGVTRAQSPHRCARRE